MRKQLVRWSPAVTGGVLEAWKISSALQSRVFFFNKRPKIDSYLETLRGIPNCSWLLKLYNAMTCSLLCVKSTIVWNLSWNPNWWGKSIRSLFLGKFAASKSPLFSKEWPKLRLFSLYVWVQLGTKFFAVMRWKSFDFLFYMLFGNNIHAMCKETYMSCLGKSGCRGWCSAGCIWTSIVFVG